MTDQVLEICDSEFERDVGTELLKRGYRLRAQVPVAGYRLDFVVEGKGNHRLAIECDGEPYHGPDRWSQDVKRQKALERLGWVFWRVWGSHWYSDRQGCIDDLIATLDRLNIPPLGANPSPFAWTEHHFVSSSQPAGGEPKSPEENATVSPPSEAPATSSELEGQPTFTDATEKTSEKSRSDGIRVGDSVVIRFNDTNKVRRLLLSATENRPDEGIVHVNQPLGQAVLGADIDDEIEFPHAKGARIAIVERVERAGR